MKKPKGPPFVRIRRDMLKDPEWRKLSNSAKVLWIYLRAKFNYKTKDEITLAYLEMKDIMSSRTVSRALNELIQDNWIKKTKQGGLYGGLCTYKFNGKYKDFNPDMRNPLFYQ